MNLQYITSWHFWVAVVIVAVVINFIYNKFTGKGKLV